MQAPCPRHLIVEAQDGKDVVVADAGIAQNAEVAGKILGKRVSSPPGGVEDAALFEIDLFGIDGHAIGDDPEPLFPSGGDPAQRNVSVVVNPFPKAGVLIPVKFEIGVAKFEREGISGIDKESVVESVAAVCVGGVRVAEAAGAKRGLADRAEVGRHKERMVRVRGNISFREEREREEEKS